MTQEVNQNTIILLSMFLDKYRDMSKNSNSYAAHKVAEEALADFEALKDTMVKPNEQN